MKDQLDYCKLQNSSWQEDKFIRQIHTNTIL
jgi:hypothetical protein